MQPLPEAFRVAEAILFAAEGPLSAQELAMRVSAALQLPPGALTEEAVDALLEELNAELEATGRPYRARAVAGGYALVATPEAAQWLERAFAGRSRRRLSQAALEVLAIVAYRQPITRAEIDAIRGVNSSEVVQSLVERGLLAVVGHAAAPGRPVLYGTTVQFLHLLGINSLQELPPLEEVEGRAQLPLFEPVQLDTLDARLRQLRLLHQEDSTPDAAPEQSP
jgi:segregation and condensation protein B